LALRRAALFAAVMAAYVAAALPPCVPGRETRAALDAAHWAAKARADLGHQRAAPAIAAPCSCGCHAKAQAASTSRLAPVVPSVELALALPAAVAAVAVGGVTAHGPAFAPPDPVPIAS
jgi:hypothetical protein